MTDSTDRLFESLEKINRDGLNNLFNGIEEKAIRDVEFSSMCTDFILNLLMLKKSGKGRIDQLLLDKNGIESDLESFIKKQNAVDNGYAMIVCESFNYYRFKITKSGITHFDIISKRYNIIVPTQIERINRYILKRILKLIFFIFKSANKMMSKIMKSWIIGFILFLVAILMLLIEYDKIVNLLNRILK